MRSYGSLIPVSSQQTCEESEFPQEPCLTHHPGAMAAPTVFPSLGTSEEGGLPHTSARAQLPQSMKIMHEIMYKLEVLYVLCVLLMGRQRNQVSAPPASAWRAESRAEPEGTEVSPPASEAHTL